MFNLDKIREESDGFIAVVRWHIDDIKNALDARGIKPTDKNVIAFLEAGGSHVLYNRQVEEGNVTLEDLVSIYEEKFTDEDDASEYEQISLFDGEVEEDGQQIIL